MSLFGMLAGSIALAIAIAATLRTLSGETVNLLAPAGILGWSFAFGYELAKSRFRQRREEPSEPPSNDMG